jgi:nucleoside-diphosphate-sugar epimerase
MKLFVTGACGYKGTVLVPKLLEQGHEVVAFDIQWFGNRLPIHARLTVVQGDVRHPAQYDLAGVDAVIHLSSIANDPAGDLDPKLTWEISCLATMQLADKAKRQGVNRFIFASSGSVYGVKEETQVTEELELGPISEYNKTKMCAERILLSYADDMLVQIVRPATVCGYSPTMRNDVSVNMLTMLGLKDRRITVFGGDQTRPNVHIDDITDLYCYLLDHPQYSGVFNAGFENITILEIAEMVTRHVDAEVVVTASGDPRSYRVNSDKLLATGFAPKKSVEDAIKELVGLYREGVWKDDPSFHRMQWMKSEVLDALG